MPKCDCHICDAPIAPDAEVRYLGDVQRLALAPDDIVVVTLPGRQGADTCGRIHDHMKRFLGDDRKIIVFADGVKIGVLSPESV